MCLTNHNLKSIQNTNSIFNLNSKSPIVLDQKKKNAPQFDIVEKKVPYFTHVTLQISASSYTIIFPLILDVDLWWVTWYLLNKKLWQSIKRNFSCSVFIHSSTSQTRIERIKARIRPQCKCNIKNGATESFHKLSTNMIYGSCSF